MAQPQSYMEVDGEGSEYPMLIIRSAAGKRFYLVVDEDGILTTTEII